MIHLYSALVEPFAAYGFMRRALVACLALSLGSGPIGVFLVLRRMSLMGDAMSHAILPGAAIGFLAAGLSLWAMSAGGLVVGLAVALLAGLVSRATSIREDASLAGFYLISLALGVLLVSLKGSSIDLLHVLFGTILGVGDASLLLVAGIATVSLFVLAPDRRMLRPGLPAGAGRDRLALSHPVPGTGGAEPGGGLPGAGHPHGRRADDAARGGGSLLGG